MPSLLTMSNWRGCGIALITTLLWSPGCAPGALRSGALPAARAMVPQVQAPAKVGRTFLYVGGSILSKYALDGSEPLRTIKLNNVVQAALALGSDGNLYEANGNPSYAQILVVDARSLKLRRAVDFGPITSLVIDRFGYLYTANGGFGIYVYAPGATRLVHIIRRGAGSAFPLAFDRSGRLYAGNVNARSVSVYAPTKVPGHMKFVRSIHEGVDNPNGLALGPSGDLFVASWPYPQRGFVSVYAPGGASPVRKITSGIDTPWALRVNSAGWLYVANRPFARGHPAPGWVSVYAPGGTQPIRKITRGIHTPVALALSFEDVYVGNTGGGGSVTVYSGNGTKLLRTITEGAQSPEALVIGSP